MRLSTIEPFSKGRHTSKLKPVIDSILKDINGCLSDNGKCQQRCINKPGPGIECSCWRGYRTLKRQNQLTCEGQYGFKYNTTL